MRYGHNIGTNLLYSQFFTIGVLLLAITIFFLVFMEPRKNKSEQNRVSDILNERYAKNEIDDDKYNEVMSLLEDEDSNSSAIILLKERYALGNISSLEFIKMRNMIKARRT
ncbi:hypothetical protein JCM17380_06450 [Desulfosporosinus burensis]